MKKLFVKLAVIIALVSFSGLAFASIAETQPAAQVDSIDGAVSVVGSILKNAKESRWVLVAGSVISLLVFGIRRWGKKALPWFSTDRGGVVLVFVSSVAGGLVTSLADGQPLGWSTVLVVLEIGFLAIGGYHGLKSFLFPKDKKAAK